MTDKEREILQFEEDYKEQLDALYDRIHVQVEQNIVKQAQLRKKRQRLGYKLSSIAVALAIVITLSVVLPIVLQPSDDALLRYNDTNLSYAIVSYTLRDYIEGLGDQVLYLNWYDTCEDRITTRYYDANNNEKTVYMREYFVDENGYIVELSVLKIDDNIIVETFETDWSEPDSATINSVDITYIMSMDYCNLKFEYEGYQYYLNFMNNADWEGFVKPTIESMFEIYQTNE